MRRVGIMRDDRYLLHRTGVHHIEVPRRLETIYGMLDAEQGLAGRLTLIPPRLASLEEIEMVHDPRYVEKILDTAGEQLRYLDPDTVTSEQTCEAAFLAAGGVMEAVRNVLSGEVDTAFALVRPPGHHAERNRQMGFCIFNNEALAAQYALRCHGLERIMIIDWDVHHGNGTQHIFERSPAVLSFSTHRHPFYPGTGNFTEVGRDEGAGFSFNVPLPAQRDDSDYAFLFRRLLDPLAREFRPDLLVIAAGFDPHHEDPIGGMRMTEHGFGVLAHIVLSLADDLCGGRSVFLLEGGYDLGALRRSSRAVLEAMLDGVPAQTLERVARDPGARSPVFDVVKGVKDAQGQYWGFLRHV